MKYLKSPFLFALLGTLIFLVFYVSSQSAGVPERPKIVFFGPLTNFLGTSASGTLAISTGTTTINCAGQRVCVRDYSRLSVTNKAQITFINPHPSGTVVLLRVASTSTVIPKYPPSAFNSLSISNCSNCSSTGTVSTTKVFLKTTSTVGFSGVIIGSFSKMLEYMGLNIGKCGDGVVYYRSFSSATGTWLYATTTGRFGPCL